MRKHLLRILTVLLVVCFGAALFAACGDNNDKDPDQGSETTYTLTYNANGGTDADITETHKAGEEVILKGGETFTRDDHTLTKWNDGTKDYDLGAKFEMPKANVTMKAVWTENTTPPTVDKYTVTMATNANAEFKIVEPANETSFAKGTTVKFTVTAKTGFKVKSVKNGTQTLTADADGKYSVTVGEANIVITVETEPTTTPPAETYTVTVTGDHVAATFDEQGPYAEGTIVKFTLTVDSGYEIVSVKNGDVDVPKGEDNKYSVTVAKANITITVETEAEATPEEKQITEFANANMVGGNLYLRMKAKGYDTADELKEDLKLLIGTKEIACASVEAPGAGSEIYTVRFAVTKEDFAEIADGSSVEVKLSSTATGEHACPATSVDANQNSLTFDTNDVYTLKIEGEKLVLAYEHKETVEKKVSGFAGTAFVKEGENKIYIAINITTQGYTEEEVKGAKLKIDTLEFTAASNSSSGVLYYYIVGEEVTAASLEAGDHLVTLELDGTSYKCPTVQDGQIEQPIELGGKTYTLKVEGEGDEKALHLVIADAAPVVDSIEGVWTGTADDSIIDTPSGVVDVRVVIKKIEDKINVVITMVDHGAPEQGQFAVGFCLPKLSENKYGVEAKSPIENESPVEGESSMVMTITLDGGKLTIVGLGESEEGLVLSEHSTELGTIHVPESGTYSNSEKEISVTFGETPKMRDVNGEHNVRFEEVGEYIVCFYTDPEDTDDAPIETAVLILFEGDADNTFNVVYGEESFVLTEGELPAKTVVTFDVDGDTSRVEAQEYTKGETFKAPDAPTKENYKFLYWYYMDGDDEVEVKEGFVPADHATDNALTLYAKFATHTYPAEADDNGNYVCTFCGAVLHPGDAVGTVVDVPEGMTELDTKGMSVSFWLHAANNDWDAIGVWTNFGKFKIALPNIQANNQGTDVSSDETIAALRTKIGNETCFPSSAGAKMLNGAEWNAICAAKEIYVTITISPEAINFYKNGVQVFNYPASMVFVGTSADGTMGDFIKAFLLSAQKKGVTVATPERTYGGVISAADVFVEYGKAYTIEEAKALYDNYLVEKVNYPKAHHEHTFVEGRCSVCGYTCPHTFTEEEGECSECHQYVGKQIAAENYGELKAGFGDNSKMYTMNKPASGKTLEVVFTATVTHTATERHDYHGVVTRIYDATVEEAFLQGNCFELTDKPWFSKVTGGNERTLAYYNANDRTGFFYRVTVLWSEADITVTYEAWTMGDDLNQGADLTSTLTFSNVEKETYNVFFGLDGMTSTDGKLVVNEYSAQA